MENDKNAGYSTFSEEEKQAFTKVINTCLASDTYCKRYLPIDPETMDVFPCLKDGVILCKLVNCAQKGTIDERAINQKDSMNIFNITENLNLALNASKAIGCQLIGVYYDAILDQKYNLILGLLWQVIKIIILGEVNIKNYPQLFRLMKDGETLSDLLKLSPEQILLRWFNFHLKNAEYPKEIGNFSNDIKDSEKYAVLLNQLDSTLDKKSVIEEKDPYKRAEKVLANAKKLGVESYITADDIVKGNQKLNTLFTAAIFNTCHGLDPPTEEEAYEAAQLLKDDAEGTREERAFRMWINSLNIDDVYVNNLYEDSKNGILLLKVMDKIKPGCVNWKLVDLNPSNPFKKVVNCNEVISAGKTSGYTIVNISGRDINEGNKKLNLAIVWQMMRAHSLSVLGNKSEKDIIDWANSFVTVSINSFKDKTLKTSLYFIEVMAGIEPRAINWDLVMKDDDSDESLKNNAMYAISIARKLGACVFLIWEDIVDLKSKMILVFMAAIYQVYQLECSLTKVVKDE